MAGAWVYILQCGDGSYYTGKRLPVTLAYAEFYESITAAIEAERRIKGWSRAKKQAMMKGDWQGLVQLSKRRGGR